MTTSRWMCAGALAAVLVAGSGCAVLPVAGIEVETDPSGARTPWIIGLAQAQAGVASVGGASSVLPVQPPLGVWLESGIAVVPLHALAEVSAGAELGEPVPVVVAFDGAGASPARVAGGMRAAIGGDASGRCDRSGLPQGYRGPVPVGGAGVVERVVAPNASWWAIGRRYALSYDDLARLNGVDAAVVRSGKGLVAGDRIFVVDRRGAGRRGAQAWCSGLGDIAGDAVWRIYPEGRRWRPAIAGGIGAQVPALYDPDALWVEGPRTRTFGEWAERGGVTVERLLRYNGVDPDSIGGDALPVGSVALPGRLSG